MKKAIVIMSVFVMSLGIAAVLYFNGVFSFDFTSPEAAADQPNPDTAVSQGQTVLPDQAIESDTQSEENRTDDGSTTTATSSTTTQTQQSTNEETTTKQTTTTTKSFFDIFTPKTTTTTRKATTTSKKTTTTTSNRTQTSTTNSTRSTTTTTTTKATTTTTKATQAQKTDYSISFNNSNGVMLTSYKTPSALYAKWGNSDLNAQGALFGADYVLIKGGYGACSIVCSNSSKNNEIIIKSNNSVIEISEIIGNNPREGVILKANGAGKATITASIPNNTKTFSFTVAVVTEDQVIKKYQKEAMRLINEYRSNAGVDPLQADNGMKQTAELRARECMQKFEDTMAAGQTSFTAEFAHSRPDGSPYSRAFPDKYLHGGWLVNENVAVGYEVPVSMCRGWYNSSGHRTTMLSTHYDRVYVGLSIADNGRFYWTLEVAGLSNATVEGGEVSDEDKAIEPVRD